MIFKLITGIGVFIMFLTETNAQKLDVAYVPTPDFVVERMLDMAKVGSGDYVIDLGCGDGRINIAAAKRGALGHGVDLDPEILKVARENAVKNGVADKVFFLEENIYITDFSQATVIAMYLFPNINNKLRPKFLETLKPGTRIVSHDFGMDEWKPDKRIGRMEDHAVLLWIVPAQVAGSWNWQTNGVKFKMQVKQKFQKIEVDVLVDGTALEIQNSSLSGKNIRLTVLNKSNQESFVYKGQVEGNEIKGEVNIYGNNIEMTKSWKAILE